MQKSELERCFAWFRAKPGRLIALRAVNLGCTGAAYAVFPAAVAVLALRRSPMALRLVLTCGLSFAAVSAARYLLNTPRPYEVYSLPPLLPKDTRGRSFPSRHVFSIFVIGTSLLYLWPAVGAALLALGVLLAAARVLSGVHFPRDVLAGAALGILSAVLGFSV